MTDIAQPADRLRLAPFTNAVYSHSDATVQHSTKSVAPTDTLFEYWVFSEFTTVTVPGGPSPLAMNSVSSFPTGMGMNNNTQYGTHQFGQQLHQQQPGMGYLNQPQAAPYQTATSTGMMSMGHSYPQQQHNNSCNRSRRPRSYAITGMLSSSPQPRMQNMQNPMSLSPQPMQQPMQQQGPLQTVSVSDPSTKDSRNQLERRWSDEVSQHTLEMALRAANFLRRDLRRAQRTSRTGGSSSWRQGRRRRAGGGDFAEGREAGGEAIGTVGAGDGGHGAAWVAVGVVPANGRAEGEREGDE
ncbi:hypothetical protein IMY05_C4659000400 [Salix suchowensis]|nr:hypothetical protein IMY05_C4659000400 [Salix suchowensis]